MAIIGGYIFLRSYIEFVKTPSHQKNYTRHFTDMMFLVLLVYPDSWFLFLAVLYAFLAPSMLELYKMEEERKKHTRMLNLLWSGSNNILAFFSLGIVIHYLILGLDPINPIWIAILYVLFQKVNSQLKDPKKQIQD